MSNKGIIGIIGVAGVILCAALVVSLLRPAVVTAAPAAAQSTENTHTITVYGRARCASTRMRQR